MQVNRIDSIICNSVLCGRLALFECIIATVAAAAIAPLELIVITFFPPSLFLKFVCDTLENLHIFSPILFKYDFSDFP